MKSIRLIVTLIIGLITTLFAWAYIQSTNYDYNSEGKFFSTEDGVVYTEQAKEIYGNLALFGLIVTGILIASLIIKRKRKTTTRAQE